LPVKDQRSTAVPRNQPDYIALNNHDADVSMSLTELTGIVHKYVNPLDSEGNRSATSNNTKLVHWLLMSGLLDLVQREGA